MASFNIVDRSFNAGQSFRRGNINIPDNITKATVIVDRSTFGPYPGLVVVQFYFELFGIDRPAFTVMGGDLIHRLGHVITHSSWTPTLPEGGGRVGAVRIEVLQDITLTVDVDLI